MVKLNAKIKRAFVCQSCGYSTPKWLGKCPECGEWSSLVEEVTSGSRGGVGTLVGEVSVPMAISSVEGREEDRISCGIKEFDRVLGGGLVPGGAVLLGGDPGIGKSTILLQAMGRFSGQNIKVLYVSGEESLRQIKLRGERLGVSSENLLILTETSLERVMEVVNDLSPQIIVIDSIQTLYTEALDSSPGSVGQVREVTSRLVSATKRLEIPLFLVGHVTKDGAIAGPKVLEHMVDTVLYFEGDSGHSYRILRAVKNRYGSVMEIGVFEMEGSGLVEVSNPSRVFLSEMPEGASGSCVVSTLEGSRTILVEVQSLVSQTPFGMPRRTAVGVDHNKVVLLIAVLEKKAGINLGNHDIFIKVAGGLRIDEPAIDLGLLASMTSNFMDRPVDNKTMIIGEVGLAGEIRGVGYVEARVGEAEKLGFSRCILPKENLKKLGRQGRGVGGEGIELIGVGTVSEAIDALLGGATS